jgi:alpha-amylase/alpha-mannosidase (GH57 family)
MNTANKYICIHGHFYQPPRENAWLEVVEMQDTAAPFHDWNARINFECYAPNAVARILDTKGKIVRITNNYGRISFNFGPTLLSWLEHADPATYRAILEADEVSRVRFGGHGSAMAQVHSHIIMPLANRRDKETQVRWGIADFEHRFGRKPEGMWLAETAADTETLEVLAENGILFTVLAPRQIRALRSAGDREWRPAHEGNLDTRQPYRCVLPSGRSIALFFYNGELSQAVAFKGILNNGKHFAATLLDALDDNAEPQLVHIATDGESYGHHHRYGEMALADCLHTIELSGMARITNYGQFLELFPPTMEAQIHENSSWSCVHGVERWRSNCGCNSGGHPGWTQAWREPLRNALNQLRDELAGLYEKQAGPLLRDVWEARNDYISVLLQRKNQTVDEFIQRHARGEVNIEQKMKLMRLMEIQRNAMLMFTSCGWFFDEISGIETNQILQYADRAMYYAAQVSEAADLRTDFVKMLADAPSNVHQDGAVNYIRNIEPARVNLRRVGMHIAVSSLFEASPERIELFNYIAESEDIERLEAGVMRLAIGRTVVKSKVTYSEKHFSFAALYLGQQNIIGNISLNMSRERFNTMQERIRQAFLTPDLAGVIGVMQEYFGPDKYSIDHLFKDEKRKILQLIADKSLRQIERDFRDIYSDNYQLMAGIARNGMPVPAVWRNAAQFIINHDLLLFFESEPFRIRELKRLAAEIKTWGLTLTDESALHLAIGERLYREVKTLERPETPLRSLEKLIQTLEIIQEMKLKPDLWKGQNVYYSLVKGYKNGEWVFSSAEWEQAFFRLGELLSFRKEQAEG